MESAVAKGGYHDHVYSVNRSSHSTIRASLKSVEREDACNSESRGPEMRRPRQCADWEE